MDHIGYFAFFLRFPFLMQVIKWYYDHTCITDSTKIQQFFTFFSWCCLFRLDPKFPSTLNSTLNLALDQCPWVVLCGRPSIAGIILFFEFLFTLCLHKDIKHLGSTGLSGLSGAFTQQFHFRFVLWDLFMPWKPRCFSGATWLLFATHEWQSWGVLGGVGVGSLHSTPSSTTLHVKMVVRSSHTKFIGRWWCKVLIHCSRIPSFSSTSEPWCVCWVSDGCSATLLRGTFGLVCLCCLIYS